MTLRPIKFALLCLLSFALFTAFTAEAFAAEPFAPSLDTGFGDNGKVAVDIGSYGDQANVVLVQPDGKILVGGSTSNTADLDFMLFRLFADGSFDPGFNIDGTVSTAVGSSDEEVFALALQEDGKILAAGYSSNNGSRDFALARYNSDGTLDREFAAEGMMVTAVSDSDDEITGVAVQPDGKILLTGTALGDLGRVVVLARYQRNGTPDYTFADEGFTLSAVGTDAQAESLLLTEEGGILVAGTYREENNVALMVLGYDENGDLDTSFGYAGVTVPLDGTVPSAGYGMAIRDDGSILVAGSVGEDGTRDGALFLFGEDGLADRTFGDKGVLVTDDEADTIFYDVLVTDEMIATTGVTVAEDGMREALLVTYAKNDGGNSAQLFQQQVAASSAEATDEVGETGEDSEEMVAQIVTTEVDNEEDYAFSLAVADPGSVVVAGASGSQDVASAAVRKYTIFHASVSGTSWNTATGNAYVLTGDAQDVTRTTALIPGEVLSGLGTVTERGVVFSMDPLPVLQDSDTSTDKDSTTDDTTDDTTTDDTDSSTTDETGPVPTSSTESSFSTTEQVILVVSTNVDATCRYNAKYDEDYGEMGGILSSSFGTGHHVDLGTLSEGEYTFYVRCKDEEGNLTTPGTEVNFSVTTDAEDAPVRSYLSPTGTTSSTSATLSLSTDVAATCKYTESSSGAGMDYNDMKKEFDTTGGTSHLEPVSGLVDGEYTYYVRCQNTSTGVANTNSSEISFIVDTSPEVTDTTDATFTSSDSVVLSVTTDEEATCKYDVTDLDYDSMTSNFSTSSDGMTHSSDIGTQSQNTYTYYVRCQDTASNQNSSSTEIYFEVTAQLNTENPTNFYAAQDFPAVDMRNIFSMSLETVGNLFVSTAIAQDDTTSTTSTTTDSTTDTTDADTEDSDFLEEGNVTKGSGTGQFTARLEDLKPGTFFYARAYAVVGGTTYYGNQVGFQTADSCFVATASYGSLFHPAVQVLRDFRDSFMLDNPISRSLVHLYYRYSPPIADVISSNAILRPVTRALLLPIVGSAWLTMRFGWLWLLLPAAAMIMLSGFGMQTMKKESL